MPILDTLKISAPDKLKDRGFVDTLDTPDVISKLLLSVSSLEVQVGRLSDRLEQYDRLNKLLDLEDVADEPAAATDTAFQAVPSEQEPTTVQGITAGASAEDLQVPPGFTPMYGAPATSEEELQPSSAVKKESSSTPEEKKFVRPWPEVTLNQLASRFKIPREMLAKAAKKMGASKEMDDSNLKPIRGADLRVSSKAGPRTRKHTGRVAKAHHRGPGRPRKSRSPSELEATEDTEGTEETEATEDADDADDSVMGDVKLESSERLSATPAPVKREHSELETTSDFSFGLAKRQRVDNPADMDKASLKYTVTNDLKYRCDVCADKNVLPHIFDDYMALYAHKRGLHPDEFQKSAPASNGTNGSTPSTSLTSAVPAETAAQAAGQPADSSLYRKGSGSSLGINGQDAERQRMQNDLQDVFDE